MTEPLVRISGLGASYGAVRALDGVDLEIEDGEFFALLGPSGCGKTTLLRVLAGFESPDAGSITLDGADLLALPPHRRPVNMMFQSYALFGHMSVAKNVGYGLARAGVPKKEAADRVAEVLEVVGLAAMSDRRPHQLSGGQRQRVALARAIVNRPRLLLLDEPLSALDKKVRTEMQAELKRLQHEVGITFVMVTHDQEEALTLADRVAVLDHGRVQQVASGQVLYRQPANRFVASFVGESNLFLADDGVVMVRPEDVRISSAESGGRVTGTVESVAFAAGTTTIAVRVPDGVTEAGRPVVVRVGGFVEPSPGAGVGLDWDEPAGVRL